MPQHPVQSAVLYHNGSLGTIANGNFSSALSANTSGTVGAEHEVARYTPGSGLTLKFNAGTKIGPHYLEDAGNAGNNVDDGIMTLAVVRPDGGRKIIARWPHASFGTVANQRDEALRLAYQSTQFCKGNLGEYVALFIDSESAVDFDHASTQLAFPYQYRQG